MLRVWARGGGRWLRRESWWSAAWDFMFDMRGERNGVRHAIKFRITTIVYGRVLSFLFFNVTAIITLFNLSPRYPVVALRSAICHVDDSSADFFAVTLVVQFIFVTFFEIIGNFNRLQCEHRAVRRRNGGACTRYAHIVGR